MEKIYGVSCAEPWGAGTILGTLQDLIVSADMVVVDESVLPTLAHKSADEVSRIVGRTQGRTLFRIYNVLDGLLHNNKVMCESEVAYERFAEALRAEKSMLESIDKKRRPDLEDYARKVRIFRMPEKAAFKDDEEKAFRAGVELLEYVASEFYDKKPKEVDSQVRTLALGLAKSLQNPQKNVLVLARQGLYCGLFDASVMLGYRNEAGGEDFSESIGRPKLRIATCVLNEQNQPYKTVRNTRNAEIDSGKEYSWNGVDESRRAMIKGRVRDYLQMIGIAQQVKVVAASNDAPPAEKTVVAPPASVATITPVEPSTKQDGLRGLYEAILVDDEELDAKFEQGNIKDVFDSFDSLESIALVQGRSDIVEDICERKSELKAYVKKKGERAVLMKYEYPEDAIKCLKEFEARTSGLRFEGSQEVLSGPRRSLEWSLEREKADAGQTKERLEKDRADISLRIEKETQRERRYDSLLMELRADDAIDAKSAPAVIEEPAKSVNETPVVPYAPLSKNDTLYANLVRVLGREPAEGEELPKSLLPASLDIDPTFLSTVARRAALTTQEFEISRGVRKFTYSRALIDKLAGALGKDIPALKNA